MTCATEKLCVTAEAHTGCESTETLDERSRCEARRMKKRKTLRMFAQRRVDIERVRYALDQLLIAMNSNLVAADELGTGTLGLHQQSFETRRRRPVIRILKQVRIKREVVDSLLNESIGADVPFGAQKR